MDVAQWPLGVGVEGPGVAALSRDVVLDCRNEAMLSELPDHGGAKLRDLKRC